MAFGTGSQNFSFSAKHFPPKYAENHSSLSGTWAGQTHGAPDGKKSLQWRGRDPLLSHLPLSLSSPHHPTTLTPSLAASSCHLPSPMLLGRAEGSFRKTQHATHLISFLFTTVLYYYLFIHPYFYFTLNVPSCVILVLLKM